MKRLTIGASVGAAIVIIAGVVYFWNWQEKMRQATIECLPLESEDEWRIAQITVYDTIDNTMQGGRYTADGREVQDGFCALDPIHPFGSLWEIEYLENGQRRVETLECADRGGAIRDQDGYMRVDIARPGCSQNKRRLFKGWGWIRGLDCPPRPRDCKKKLDKMDYRHKIKEDIWPTSRCRSSNARVAGR